ncbi:hypothetical protein CKO31_16840 [Thiohalocapsa halophila]|uniref:DUF3782 domain-containing protein n=1 Tax=Thiohalocapsa halophila TaxID=69359 RepID=A0ABS1CKC1_9GAMM|nr:hypothetical protein [Thiohalocapsa halophila]MBK1632373.1 hypothetical protein [Thiohalocapsa halophila]
MTESTTLAPRVATLEDAMQELAFQSARTQEELARLSREMREFKDEMRDFKDETRREHRELNRKWGEMANRLGTIVEDLVVPSLPQIIRETFAEDIVDLSVRRRRKLPEGRSKEFDAIAVTPTLVCVNSTKATLRSADVDRMVAEIEELREFFPSYRDIPVVGILATLAAEDGVVRYATKLGFLVLAVGDELMEVQNPAGFEPRRW